MRTGADQYQFPRDAAKAGAGSPTENGIDAVPDQPECTHKDSVFPKWVQSIYSGKKTGHAGKTGLSFRAFNLFKVFLYPASLIC
ncbi:hypothetical protein D3C87_1945920 [compost metagenome]